MGRSRQAAVIAAIEHELAVVRPGSRSPIEEAMPAMRTLLDLEALMLLTPSEGLAGLQLTRYYAAGVRDPDALRDSFAELWKTSPLRYAWYNPIRPEVDQRNRVLEAHDLMQPGELEQSAVYHRVLRPNAYHQHRQPRILLCEGASLLAWFGGFHPQKPTVAQLRLLRRIARPIRERLLIERQLDSAMHGEVLGAALEYIGAPTFVLGSQNRILEANASALALLETRRGELRDAFAGCENGANLTIDLVPLRETGRGEVRIAIARAGSRETRIAAGIAAAETRWQLTARQGEILRRIVRGEATATIAADLDVSTRSIEFQLTTMFERSQTANRAELVAAALLCAD